MTDSEQLGDYVLHEVLGTGAVGVVYRASRMDGGADLAAKLLRAEIADDPAVVTHLLREVNALQNLTHESIVRFVDLVYVRQRMALLVELVDGPNLRIYLDGRAGQVDEHEACLIGAQVAEGLAYAHSQGFMHLDLKPENILVQKGAPTQVKISDFGLAEPLLTAAESSEIFVGTPGYTAPEVRAGRTRTTAADVYALGLILLEMLGGPRAGEQVRNDTFAGWSSTLTDLVRSCIADDPLKRPKADAVAGELRAAIGAPDPRAGPVPVREQEPPETNIHGSRIQPSPPASPPWYRRPRVLILVGVIVAALLVGGVAAAVILPPAAPNASPTPTSVLPLTSVLPSSSPAPVSSTSPSSSPAPAPAPAPPPPPGTCVPVMVAASSEKAAVMSQLAARYATAGRTVNGACFEVTVNSVASGTAESDLAAGWDQSSDGPAPDAWTPAASTWLSLLRSDLNGKPDPLPSETPQSVTSTPLVLAMPEPMATALGWPGSPIGWSDVLALANDPQGWASRGHPEWGRFALGKTNPTVSTSGLAATIGTLVAATGTSADLNMTKLQDPTVQSFLRDVEQSVVHYGDTTLTYLANLQRADDSGSALTYLSAVAVEEKSVLDYNAGNPSGDPSTLGQHAPPKVPLVAVYPKEGTLYSDNPYAVLNAPWSTPEKQAGAKDFLAYLSLPEQQQVFTDGNFRTADHRPGSPITASPYLTADGVKITLNPPGPQILSAVRDLWSNVRKRARVLMVLDVSGSMEESSGVGNQSKLELAKTAATAALGQLTDTDQVGLWSFSTGLPTPDGITDDLVPVAPLVDNRGRLAAAISALAPLNGTPLYAATRGAVQAMQSSTDPGVINAVVILTDGHSDYANDADLGSLVQDLTGDSGLTGIRVFSIAYGADADIGVLTQISDASRAAAYDARDPASINKVFADVLSNF